VSLLSKLDPATVCPAELWQQLDEPTRRLAIMSLYRGTRVDPGGRREADRAIAAAVRFREAAVRELPLDRRIGYLLGSVRPDDSLATSFLLALHLEQRAEMLEAFLDELGIPQQSGLIDEAYELAPPEPQRLKQAVDLLRERFGRADVEVYLACLLAMDPEVWGGVVEALAG